MTNLRGNADLGLLLIRLALAAVFISHGVQKLMNLAGTVDFFAGLSLPAALAYTVAAIETLAGLAMLLGISTELAGLLLAIVMAGAIYTVKYQLGFLGGYELYLTLLLTALGIALAGPGRYRLNLKLKS